MEGVGRKVEGEGRSKKRSREREREEVGRKVEGEGEGGGRSRGTCSSCRQLFVFSFFSISIFGHTLQVFFQFSYGDVGLP